MITLNSIANKVISTALGEIVNRTVKEHCWGISQEPQITSRIGQALESELNGKDILDYRIRVVTQDIPDRGRGALEKTIGADLYVGIEIIDNGLRNSKGFLAQAKMSHVLRGPSGQESLRSDCDAMLARSRSSFIWEYSQRGLRVIDASDFESTATLAADLPWSPPEPKRRLATTVFSRILECTEGDVRIGLPSGDQEGRALRAAVGQMLEELRVPSAVGVSLHRQREGHV